MYNKKVAQQIVEKARVRILDNVLKTISKTSLPEYLQEILEERRSISMCEEHELKLLFEYFVDTPDLLEGENLFIMQYIKEVENLLPSAKDNKSVLTEAVKKLEAAVGP